MAKPEPITVPIEVDSSSLSHTFKTVADALNGVAEALADAALKLDGLAAARPPDAPSATPAVKPQFDTTWTETDDWEDTPQGRSKGGGCTIHDVPWAIRPAGTSKKTGAPYNAFWHCNEQDSDGTYCREKPTAAWVKAHPPA